MPFKPKKRRDYERWIRQFGWSLQKSGIDYTLYSAVGKPLCTIKISHPGGEVVADSVKKTQDELKKRGLI